MKVQIILSDNGKTYEGEAILAPTTSRKKSDGVPKSRAEGARARKPSEAVEHMYRTRFFTDERTLGEAMKQLGKDGYNFSRQSVHMALMSRAFLQRRGSKGSYRFVQKYPTGE